ncbi:hypothetical protein FSP39_023715 [Pinctada imbricata]|uniref:Uncharacterized protein n=1 Tax=Pinctada imbricata TaxID=66713 RepID=A0AA88YFR0_PINIB|nr:hypothetical protein FSP39_023715 [Pinctada imbricata]
MASYMNSSPPPSPTSSISSPLHHRDGHGTDSKREARLSASAKRQKYLRRLFKFRQMDFEYAFWQMIYLFVAPQKVYRNFQYRKLSSIGFAFALGLHFFGFIKFILWVVFVDCIGVGLLIASMFWFVTNRYMILSPPRGQDVEFGYAFDVHLNAFFPLLMILHLFQLIFLSLINGNSFIGMFFGNTLWLIALIYYVYITFLGYSALPYLKNTRTFLFPVMAVLLIYVLSLVFHWNFTKGLCYFYEYRVL